jgi:hypothetical protein
MIQAMTGYSKVIAIFKISLEEGRIFPSATMLYSFYFFSKASEQKIKQHLCGPMR